MKIFLLWDKNEDFFPQVLDFLIQRGHKITNYEQLLDEKSISQTRYFEQSLHKIKNIDYLIVGKSENFNYGFQLGFFLAKYQPKTIIFSKQNAQFKNDFFSQGCTFSYVYQKEYGRWEDIRNFLTMFKI